MSLLGGAGAGARPGAAVRGFGGGCAAGAGGAGGEAAADGACEGFFRSLPSSFARSVSRARRASARFAAARFTGMSAASTSVTTRSTSISSERGRAADVRPGIEPVDAARRRRSRSRSPRPASGGGATAPLRGTITLPSTVKRTARSSCWYGIREVASATARAR